MDNSTSALALQDFERDSDASRMIARLHEKYPRDQAEACLQLLVERTLSTSALTSEYGRNRPSGLDFFKAELQWLIEKK